MSKAAKFSSDVEISGNIDISGDINLDGTLTVDGSFSLYGYHIPDPSGENNKVLTISGDGYSWETIQSGSAGDEVINEVGQTFYEIITEQPRAFLPIDKNGVSFENTTSTIDISWSFDDIIPFDDDDGEQKILNINDNMITKVLPCITKIHFDISSTISDSGDVSEAFYIDVDTNDNYYVDNKTTPGTGTIVSGRLTYVLNYNGLRIINSGLDLNTYTINVWGENDSNDTDTFYKLTYNNLEFKSSGIPDTPAITNVTISTDTTDNLINFTIDISISDLDIANSGTRRDGSIYIEKVDLSYSLINASSELIRSSFYVDDGGVAGVEVINDLFYNDEIIHTILDATGTEDVVKLEVNYEKNFYFGAKYELQVKVKNNLSEDDTSYSSVSTTSHTDIPDSSGVSIDTFSGNTLTLKNKDNDNLGTTDIINMDDIYLYNLAQIASTNTSARILPNNTSTRTIEISDPDKTNTTDTTGFGKFIDNSTNLVTITCNLKRGGVNSESDVLLQELNYDGWNSSSPYTNVTSIADYSDNNIEPFTTISTSDIYGSEDKKGFRIKGAFLTENRKLLIKDLANAQLIEPFAASGNSGYIINYNYYRQDGNSVTTDVSSNPFFVDNFTNYADPSYNTESSSVTVTDISWVMGIPQVSTVDISFTRNHININSEHKYFQSGGLVAKIIDIKANDSVNVYSSGTLSYLSLDFDDLNTDGSYNGSFDGSLNYSNITSSQSSNTVSSLVVNTEVYNLYTTDNDYDETFSVAHYRDVTSISNYSSVFTSSSTNRIYELNPSYISNINSSFVDVHNNLVLYSNHETEIQSYTLPFIYGKFTVNNSNYPDICNNFDWDETLPTTYTNSLHINSNIGLGLDGTNRSSEDFKWIVYEIDTTNSSLYHLNTSTSVEGINLTHVIELLFDSSINSHFSNSITANGLSSSDMHIFLSIYNQDEERYHLGNLAIRFQTSANWWVHGDSQMTYSLNIILNSSNNSSGMFLATTASEITKIAASGEANWGSSDIIIYLPGTGGYNDYKLYFLIDKNIS